MEPSQPVHTPYKEITNNNENIMYWNQDLKILTPGLIEEQFVNHPKLLKQWLVHKRVWLISSFLYSHYLNSN